MFFNIFQLNHLSNWNSMFFFFFLSENIIDDWFSTKFYSNFPFNYNLLLVDTIWDHVPINFFLLLCKGFENTVNLCLSTFFFLIINKDFIKRKDPTLREIQPYIEGRKCDIRHSKIPYQKGYACQHLWVATISS